MTHKLAFSNRIYPALLLLYPAALRRQFGQEMIEVFSEQIQDAYQRDGWLGEVRVWRCVASETVRTLVSSHMQIVGVSLVSVLAAYGVMYIFFWSTFGQH